jgi:hypothetical protein
MNRDFQKSRPLNIKRVCHDPKITDLVNEVKTTLFQGDTGKPLGRVLPMLLSELHLAWLEDPDSCIGLHMTPSRYPLDRYNPLNISQKLIHVVRKLAEEGWIGLEKGQQTTDRKRPGRTTRIWAERKLISLFTSNTISADDFGLDQNDETVILRNADKTPIEYEDTPETERMRSVLRDYNRLLNQSFIDIPELDEPAIKLANGETLRVSPHQKTVHRIFSNGSWEEHGRFYGAWWHSLPSKWRQRIHINDALTVEYDFSSMLPTLMYAEKGEQLKKDAYSFSLPEGNPFGRSELKLIVLIAINAATEQKTIYTIRDKLQEETNLSFTNEHISQSIEVFRKEHPVIADQICSGVGLKLMKTDSDIAEKVIEKFTSQDTPVLSIHDSFIVPWDKDKELITNMKQSFKEVTGVLPFNIASESIEWRKNIEQALSSPTITNPNQRHSLLHEGRAFESEGYKKRRTKFYNE